ncbi:recombinase family protein [Actinokineospora globicatena]|uniref:recombinase family protein n=1 Tax=Actinokineospora globicatena TaxID=103729 RepID=UPI0024A0F4E6|nr:recombinase family protein [Actinokineospora globicatena]MCP2304721.1 Resolvase, N terminal domain [Actinokineospora globicatena]GLW77903.1 hypothetical protein Aglo01_23850 [Actinokineospora globicatena]GLW85430.1 hypothetical protein Aglo02_30700 [Actinokineospora globicatena]
MQRCVRYYRKSSGDDFATQEMRCGQYEARMGLTLDPSLGESGVYQDANISGGRDDRKGYNALLADIVTGKLKGYFLIVRDQERLTRGESSRFEEVAYNAEKSGVRIFDATTGREIKDDLTSGVLAVIARQDRKRTSILISNNKELRALQGTTPRSSHRRFGYAHGYTQIVWEEAKTWRRARRWVLAGWSLHRIVQALRRRGEATMTAGSQLDISRLKRMLVDYTYAAWRVFSRDLEINGVAVPKGQPIAKGTWPAIATREEIDELREILAGKKSYHPGGKEAKRLLLGVLVCDECGTKLSTGYVIQLQRGLRYGSKDRPKVKYFVYKCDKQKPWACGGVARDGMTLDRFMVNLTYEALKRLPRPVGGSKPANQRKLIEQAKDKIAEARAAYKADQIGLDDFVDVRNEMTERIVELARSSEAEAMPIDSADAFLGADMDSQRDTIRRLWPVIGLKKAGKGVRFKPDQLVFPDGGFENAEGHK